MRIPLPPALLLCGAACSPGGLFGGGASNNCRASVTIMPFLPVAEVRAREPTTVDLKLGDKGKWKGHPLKVELFRGDTPVKIVLDAPSAEMMSPKGTLGEVSVPFVPADAAGAEPGAHTLRATLGCPVEAEMKGRAEPGTAEAPIALVRLGVVRLGLGPDGRVPLMYHAVARKSGNYFPIAEKTALTSIAAPAGEADLDDVKGVPRAFPKPWDDLETPPTDAMGAVVEQGASLPVSLALGTKPEVRFTVGKTATGTAGKPVPAGLGTQGLPRIRLVFDGGANPPDAPAITEGAEVRIPFSFSPVDGVNRFDLPVKWHFEAMDGNGWRPIPGAVGEAPVRFYGVLGNEMGGAPPNIPWVAIVDGVTRKIGGKSTDPAELRAALVEFVYAELGLAYDRAQGASAYTTYRSDTSFDAGKFDLAAFIKKSRGKIVNCSDCASILSTYANMIGVRLRYAIIGWDFPLNPILGIGGSTPGSPFNSGRMAFSYHAVTSPDSAMLIDDATLALDGDDDPAHAPFKKLLVQNIGGAEYLQRLSPGKPSYKYVDQATTVR